MANRVNVEISANTSGYKNAIDEAKGANKQFQSSIEDIDIKGLNREFRTTQKTVQGLALELNRLQKAGKVDTAQYRALQREFIEAKKYAAELQDVVGDTKEEIKHMASDTAGWDAFKEGINIARDTASAIAAATGTEEEMKGVIMEIARIQTIANTAISIGNALQKQSALMSGIRKIQEIALAKAIDAEAAATGRATIAQKLFNAVAKANPYVLLATGLVALGGALAAYMHFSKQATAEDEQRAKKLEDAKKAQESYNSTMAQSFGNLMGKYAGLRAQWKQLSSEHEKIQWIKNNKSEFEQLGLKINNVADAENTFEKNTGAVIDGFKKRAEAAAVAARMVELYSKQLELENRYLQYYHQIKKQAGDVDTSGSHTRDANGNTYNNGESVYNERTGNYEYTAKGAAKVNDELLKTDKTLKTISNDYKEINSQIDTTSNKLAKLSTPNTSAKTSTSGTSSKDNKDIKYTTDSLADLENKLSDLQKKRKDGLLPDMDTDTYIAKIEDLKKQIEAKKIELGIELPKTELEEIDNKIKTLKANQLNVKTRLDAQQYQAELKKLEDEKHQINVKLGFEVEPSAFEKLSKAITTKLNGYTVPIDIDVNAEPSKLDKLKKELEQYTYLEEHVELSDEDLKVIKDKIKQLKNEVESEEVRIGISTVSNKVIAQKEEEKTELENKKTTIINDNGGIPEPNTDAYNELLEIMQQIRDVEQEITDMQDPLNASIENQNKLTQQRAQALQGIGGAISGLGSAMAQLGDKEDKGVQVAALIAQAIGSVLAGMGTAIASAGQTGNPWVWLAFSVAALATAATTIAQIKNLGASAKGFSEGGVIGGNSFYGDNLLARVNSNEMIFNTPQQKRLYELANGAKPAGGAYTSTISSVAVEGTDLILTINNTLMEEGKNTI